MITTQLFFKEEEMKKVMIGLWCLVFWQNVALGDSYRYLTVHSEYSSYENEKLVFEKFFSDEHVLEKIIITYCHDIKNNQCETIGPQEGVLYSKLGITAMQAQLHTYFGIAFQIAFSQLLSYGISKIISLTSLNESPYANIYSLVFGNLIGLFTDYYVQDIPSQLIFGRALETAKVIDSLNNTSGVIYIKELHYIVEDLKRIVAEDS